MSASGAAVSAAGASGFSPAATVCALACGTDAMPRAAAMISGRARLYPILEIISPPAFQFGDHACTSSQNYDEAVIARNKATKQYSSSFRDGALAPDLRCAIAHRGSRDSG